MDVLKQHYCGTILEKCLSAILVNDSDEVIFSSSAAQRYLKKIHAPSGIRVLNAVVPSLQLEVDMTLSRARHSHCLAQTRPIKFGESEHTSMVQVTVQPLDAASTDADIMLLTFNELVHPESLVSTSEDAAAQTVVSELYADLMRSRDEFHRLTMKHEESVKNLATLNEELYSINEELRCATHEHEANRAMLEAGNAALNDMVARITKANNDLENFVDSTDLALVFVDYQLRVVRYTVPAAALFNFIPRDVGRSLLDITHSLDYQCLEADIRDALDRRQRREREVRSSEGAWFSVRIVPYHGEADDIDGVVLTFLDISLRKEAEEKLHLGEQQWKLAVEASGDGIWDWNVSANKSTFSPAWCQIGGYDVQAFSGKSLEQWMSLIHPHERPRAVNDIRACANGDPGWFSHEYRIQCKDGHWKWVLSRGAVVERDLLGHATRIIATLTDISHKKMLEHQIWYRANYDHLTGLPNRNFFLDRLDYEVMQSRRANHPFALMFIDLDRFKEVNDLHGHSAGDLLLKVVADELKGCTRESDTVARLGGDEFTVILPGTGDIAGVKLIADEILNKLSEPVDLVGHVVHISASVGVTFFPKDADNAVDLVRNADQAMYVAKNSGRNRCRFFSQAMQDAAIKRLSIINDLHEAADGQLTLCFQPIVDMQSRRIVKAEALVRWRHPTQGLLLPNIFIHLAEESGLIGTIGDWVFAEAAKSALQISKLIGRPFQISINKSPLELSTSDSFPKLDLLLHLEKIGLDKRNIVIEITEGVLLHASPQIKDRIAALRAAGIQFALDDFGTGYSSMSYLTRYSVDFLKIDQSFVRDHAPDPTNRAIAEAMIVLAHKLRLKVIAEGVERQDQHDWLRAAGCDYSQGFLYSKPLELRAFEELIAKGG